jgi:site-specific DNA-cytosine methylase
VQFARILEELCPPWALIENVASGANYWIDTVVGSLERQGYHCLPVPLSAADVGAPHGRARVFVLARHPDRDVQPVVQQHAQVARMSSIAGSFPDWTVDPCIRVVDGISPGMVALGNAAMPQMVEVVGRMLLNLEEEWQTQK